jgi:predicted cobalt transporter CbtA
VKLLGLMLLVALDIIGALDLVAHNSPMLSTLFAARSLVAQAVTWTALGVACGWFWQFQVLRATAAVPN